MLFGLWQGSLDKALDITGLAERKLRAFPELTTVISRTGQTGISLEARGVDKTGFTGILKPRSEWQTASIAIFSLIPMLYASSPESEVQRPLAVVVVGGLLISTLLTFVVLPVLYRWFELQNLEEEV